MYETRTRKTHRLYLALVATFLSGAVFAQSGLEAQKDLSGSEANSELFEPPDEDLFQESKTVTAAMHRAANNATYLFYSDGQYARSSSDVTQGFDGGYPTAMPGGWGGIPSSWYSDITAALSYEDSTRGYMWHGGEYLRLNDVRGYSNYPKAMPGGWRNMPGHWNGQVDAAMYFKPWNKHYFFKGDEYVRLSGITVDDGYPRKLPGGWRGMPALFASGIDAAAYRNGHVYMIKGDQYIRFSGTRMDSGYPKPMSSWPE